MTSFFTNTFGGSAVSPADVAFAAYSYSSNLTLYWPQFSNGQSNVVARFMNLTATATSISVYMPDATLASVGYDTIIYNAGSNPVTIVTYTGAAIATISAGTSWYILLTDNTTQSGTWQTVQFGAATSQAQASSLAGLGLLAASGLIEVNSPATIVSNSFTATVAARGQTYVWTGGAGTITLPSAASAGNGFYLAVANNGSGALTVSSSDNIDGSPTSSFATTQSGFLICTGSTWYSVGKGIANTFSVTILNLSVAGSSDVTLTSAQAQNIIQQYTGTLTGNINIIVPTTAQIYFIYNNTSGSYSLTVKTASGTGITVAQGSHAILYCDGTNVLNSYTSNIGSSVVLPVGSASSPTLTFTSNLTSGLFSNGSNTFSATANAGEVMRFTAATSAVNYWLAAASITANALNLSAAGTDTNIGININTKGTGTVTLTRLDGTPIGANTASTGAFTTLAASGSITGSSTITGTALIPSGSSAPSNGMYLPSTNTIGFATNGNLGVRIDSYGSIGLATTPGNWTGLSGSVVETGSFVLESVGGNSMALAQNVTASGTSTEQYRGNYQASTYVQQQGQHIFKYAGTGTAGSNIGWSTAMTIDNSGLIGIGTNPSTYKVKILGTSSLNTLYVGGSATNGAITIDNTSGGAQSALNFADAGSNKWIWFKDGSNIINLYDGANNKYFIQGTPGGTLKIGPNQTFTLDQSGNCVVGGTLTGTTATFSGAISGTTGTFSGAVSGTTGTFSGNVSGVNGTFTGPVSGTTGTFSGAVSGTNLTASGTLNVTGTSTLGVIAAKQVAKAWVTFNNSGTIAANYNVSSVTKNGTGDFTINFSNALTDANYSPSIVGQRSAYNDCIAAIKAGVSPTTSALRVTFCDNGANLADITLGSVHVFDN